MPTLRLSAKKMPKAAGNAKAPVAATPINWVRNEVLAENRPTASVPQMPQTKWTGTAPTGSSSWMRSRKRVAVKTKIPPIVPIKTAVN